MAPAIRSGRLAPDGRVAAGRSASLVLSLAVVLSDMGRVVLRFERVLEASEDRQVIVSIIIVVIMITIGEGVLEVLVREW